MVVSKRKKAERKKKLDGLPWKIREQARRQVCDIDLQLPEWVRTGRPEKERAPWRVKKEKDYRESCIAQDLDPNPKSYVVNNSISEIEKWSRVNIRGIIRTGIKKLGGKRPFAVLDLGCGQATAATQIKQEFQDNARVVGVTLEKVPGADYGGIDRLVKGNIHEVKIGGQFDLIYSWTGAVRHTYLTASAIEKVIGLLRPGGVAVIDIGRMEPQFGWDKWRKQLLEIETILKANGIRRMHYYAKRDLLVFSKPNIRLP
ncbi:MAG: class I SAM-dependent methyltransferase [Candidatus Diapherotrites archaeon]|nr:class I SAM-dependent methyltransferase [Candidatus Diapherotrites archaeon]